MISRILSGIDYRIINFMADTGRMPNQEERARLLGHGVNNANNPNIQDLQSRIAILTNERDQARERVNQLTTDNDELRRENSRVSDLNQNLQNNVVELQRNLANRSRFNNISTRRIDDFKILANSHPQNEVIQGEHSGILGNMNQRQDIGVGCNLINGQMINLVVALSKNSDNSDNEQDNDCGTLSHQNQSNSLNSQNVEDNVENSNIGQSQNIDDNRHGDAEVKNALEEIKKIFDEEKNFSKSKKISGALLADGVNSMETLLEEKSQYKGTGRLHDALMNIFEEFENGERVGSKKNYLCKDAVDKIRGILKKVEDLLS